VDKKTANEHKAKIFLEDDIKEPVGHLIEHRLPWLTLGLLGGMGIAMLVSGFEESLSRDVRLVFFIPIIVYMSDAIGTQTETIYIRHLKKTGAGFWKYIVKETILGFSFGVIFGTLLGFFAYFWLKDFKVALAAGIAMLINVTIAPILATVVPNLLYRRHTDPALGSGPLATVIQDGLSLFIYFSIATLIIF